MTDPIAQPVNSIDPTRPETIPSPAVADPPAAPTHWWQNSAFWLHVAQHGLQIVAGLGALGVGGAGGRVAAGAAQLVLEELPGAAPVLGLSQIITPLAAYAAPLQGGAVPLPDARVGDAPDSIFRQAGE